jgi:hypothetical protein
MLILFALLLPLICLFVGFGIDFGFGFLTKAQLGKAADAAALAAMLNLGKGQTEATRIGQAEFNLNTNPKWGLYVSAPVATITYPAVSPGSEPIVNVAVSAKIRTFFIKVGGFPTLTITNFSQATRPPIILSLVLDKSGSMNDNGGAQALPPAVTDFVSYFMENTDQLGVVTFSTLANPDVPMTKDFQRPIATLVKALEQPNAFGGATYAQGGLVDANAQVTGISPLPSNAVQVVVFFTDGWANTNHDTLGGTSMNYGGCAPYECLFVNCMDPRNGNALSPATYAPNPTTSVGNCGGLGTFPAQDPSLPTQALQTRQNISTEADYRAVQLANQMRASGITVYSIGLGNLANPNAINTTYLQDLANDPASPGYNANEPSGIAAFAPTANDLDGAFQQIASKILLRLTH